MPKEVVPGEHYIVKDLPIYEASKEADAEKRRVLLEDREKKKNEGTLRKAPGQKRDADSPPKKTPAKRRKLVKNGKDVKEPTPPKEFAPPPIIHEAEVMIEEPVNPALIPSQADPDTCGAEPLKHLLGSAEAVCATPWRKREQKARVSPLTIRTAGSCSGDGATLKEASLGAQSEVRTPRAASRAAARD
ncbi:hypothetical protein CK203_106960 [Vitis vinifera]|uniref:Uncharacterized protein n=1 Tax=Vitis vinifera TaxID=29760 RepID=A0A438FDK0_VITVI|nr:hypothetical protein CK203_106960 [Vitis vinifera]